MTSLCRNPAMLLLFLSASPLLFTHATTSSPPATRRKIVHTSFGTDESYDEEFEEDLYDDDNVSKKTTLVHQAPLQPCQYNPCLENQEPCHEMGERIGCVCPGVSGTDVPPHAPRIEGLLPISKGADRGKIAVHWCAPSSEVSGYRVVIEGGEAMEFGESSRQGVVESLEVGTRVCVQAVNRAGNSPTSDFSCQRYDPPEASDHKMLAAVIGGGVAILLLLVITAVIVSLHQMRKKAKRDSADGLGNPSYSTEGTL